MEKRFSQNPKFKVERYVDPIYIVFQDTNADSDVGQPSLEGWLEVPRGVDVKQLELVVQASTMDAWIDYDPKQRFSAEHIYPWPETKELLKPQKLMEAALELVTPKMLEVLEKEAQEQQFLHTFVVGNDFVRTSPISRLKQYHYYLMTRIHAHLRNMSIELPTELAQNLDYQVTLSSRANSKFVNALDTSFSAVFTFEATLFGIFQENSNLVANILMAIAKKLDPHLYDQDLLVEYTDILIQNEPQIAEFMWKTLRYGYNGYITNQILQLGNLDVSTDAEGYLNIELNKEAKTARTDGLVYHNRVWENQIDLLERITAAFPGVSVHRVFTGHGLHRLRPQKRCPITQQRIYELMLKTSMNYLKLYSSAVRGEC